jgi:hypothetical protein
MAHVDEIVLRRWFIIRTLTGITLLLLVASIAGQFIKHVLGHHVAFGFVRLFYLDAEANIPTFFSTMLLLLASLLLALIATFKKSCQDPFCRHWVFLSLILLYMAIDEASEIHEMLNKLGWWITGRRTGGMFHYGWVMFGMAMATVVTLSYFKFLFHLPGYTRIQFITAAMTFLGGALGVEILEGLYSASHGGENSFQFSMIVTVEEGLEMAGVIILINALLAYIQTYQTEIRLRFAVSRDNAVAPTQRHAA